MSKITLLLMIKTKMIMNYSILIQNSCLHILIEKMNDDLKIKRKASNILLILERWYSDYILVQSTN